MTYKITHAIPENNLYLLAIKYNNIINNSQT